jgi:hypothetical protein
LRSLQLASSGAQAVLVCSFASSVRAASFAKRWAGRLGQSVTLRRSGALFSVCVPVQVRRGLFFACPPVRVRGLRSVASFSQV